LNSPAFSGWVMAWRTLKERLGMEPPWYKCGSWFCWSVVSTSTKGSELIVFRLREIVLPCCIGRATGTEIIENSIRIKHNNDSHPICSSQILYFHNLSTPIIQIRLNFLLVFAVHQQFGEILIQTTTKNIVKLPYPTEHCLAHHQS
jgi:hypothetical protein